MKSLTRIHPALIALTFSSALLGGAAPAAAGDPPVCSDDEDVCEPTKLDHQVDFRDDEGLSTARSIIVSCYGTSAQYDIVSGNDGTGYVLQSGTISLGVVWCWPGSYVFQL